MNAERIITATNPTRTDQVGKASPIGLSGGFNTVIATEFHD